MTEAKSNPQWRLLAFPCGTIRASDFELVHSPMPVARDGQILARNIYLSLDPTNRIWASGEETYLPALRLGEVMRGITLAVVEESKHPKLVVGDLVTGALGWQ